MEILDGKKLSQQIKEEIKLAVSARKDNGLKVPHLAAVLVGNDGASLTYVGSKVRSCEQVGFKSTLIRLEDSISQEALLSKIKALNSDLTLDGYIVQLPLPKHIDEEKILMAIDPNKDVDGFHPANFGRMALDMESFIPATPFGIMEMLNRTGLAHGYSYNTWSDVVTYTPEFVEQWLASPQTSMYYSLQVMQNTQAKDNAMAALNEDYDFTFAESSEEQTSLDEYLDHFNDPSNCVGCAE